MAELVLQKKGEKSWIRYIKQRIRRNKNMLMLISGATGSGKSYCSLRIAQELDPEFNIERCVFTGIELMDLINSGKLGSGNVIVFEEAGIDLSNRSWQSTMNKLLNFLLQTFRHKNFILIFNSPYADFIDKSSRKLFHSECQTLSIDFKNKQVRLKPLLIQYNSRNEKFYYKFLRCVTKDGVLPVKVWRVDMPDAELLKQYERKKNEFTSRLNKNILEELKDIHRKKKKMKCLKCGYRWIPRTDVPVICPQCRKNPY